MMLPACALLLLCYACTAVLPGCVLPLSVRATMLPVYVLLLSMCAAALPACAPPLSVHAAMLSPAHCSRLNVVRCCLPARRPCPSVLRCRLRAHYSCPFRAVMRPEYRCIMCCCWHISATVVVCYATGCSVCAQYHHSCTLRAHLRAAGTH